VTDFLMVMWYSSEERENTESLGPPECRPVSVDRRHSSMRLRHFFIFLRPEVHRGEPRGPEPDPTDGNHGKLVEKKNPELHELHASQAGGGEEPFRSGVGAAQEGRLQLKEKADRQRGRRSSLRHSQFCVHLKFILKRIIDCNEPTIVEDAYKLCIAEKY
jgi:hypothetical protein